MKWAMDDPVRFLREKDELTHLETETGWLSTAWRISEEGSITVDIDMYIHGRLFAGEMTYPDAFPDSPPYIRPRDKSERWTSHQYGVGGSLCLQWRADNWHSNVTGADMVRSAYELLSTEQHPELPHSVPSAHRLTEGQNLNFIFRRYVPTSEVEHILTVLPLPSRTRISSSTVYNEGSAVMFIARVADAQDELRNVSDIPQGLIDFVSILSLSYEGWVFRSDYFSQRQSLDSVEALIQMLMMAGFNTDDVLVKEGDKYKAKTIILLGKEWTSLRVFLIDSGEQPVLREHRVVSSPNSALRLSEESQKLSKVRIGIVGLGSVGSKLAISLARSGVRQFLLVDDDYLTPGNLVRHELGWAQVGAHKAWAVSNTLALIAAGVKVDVKIIRLAGQESAVTAAVALKDLSNCDLLIDATANPEVFLLLAATARRNRIPMCWGEIFAGGYGGMIARARPKHDPNPLAVRDAYHSYLSTLPEAPFKNMASYDGSDEQPLIAYDSDVGFITTALTRLAVDTALCREPSEFPYSLYLLGMRREWIFEEPFDTRPVEISGEGWERDENAVRDEDRVEVAKVLINMYEGKQSANSDSTD